MFITFEEVHDSGVALVNREHIVAAYPEQTQGGVQRLRLYLAGQESSSLFYSGPGDMTDFEFKKRVDPLTRLLAGEKERTKGWTKKNDEILRGTNGMGDLYQAD